MTQAAPLDKYMVTRGTEMVCGFWLQVLVVALTGDRGLCGGYNTYAIKKVETRLKELKDQGIDFDLVCVGNKGNQARPKPPALPPPPPHSKAPKAPGLLLAGDAVAC